MNVNDLYPPHRSLAEMLAAQARSVPMNDAVVDGDITLTYLELFEKSTRVAGALVHAGVSPGDRVAIWMGDSWAWPVCYYGALLAGAVTVPINTRFRAHEVTHILRDSAPAAMFVDSRLSPHLEAVADNQPGLVPPTVFWIEGTTGGHMDDSWVNATEALEYAGPAVAIEDVDPYSPVTILYTSGTTSAPKGCVVRSEPFYRTCHFIAANFLTASEDRLLSTFPLFSTFGIHGLHGPLTHGGATVLMGDFDAFKVLSLIESESVSIVYGQDLTLQPLMDHPKRESFNLESWRTGMGLPISKGTIERLIEELGVTQWTSAYGMSETSSCVTMHPGDAPLHSRLSNAGRPLPGVRLQVRDDSGRELANGQVGRLWVSGYSVMTGYLNRPELNAEVFDGLWFNTGDLGSINDYGELTALGRESEVFKSKGFLISPIEIEGFLNGYPGVEGVALVPQRRDDGDNDLVAFVQVASGAQVSGDELVRWCKGNIASYKIPSRVVMVDSLPRTASGKVQKGLLTASLRPAAGS